MSKAVSGGQALQIVASLGVDTPWGELDGGSIQEFIELSPKERGARFAAFFKNGGRVEIGGFFRETGELTIDIPALQRPMLKDLQAKFSWIKSIERDTSPTDAVTLKLGAVLWPDEDRVDGSEYERRIASKVNITLGYQQAEWLMKHQDEHPAFKALFGQIYINFPGLVVVNTSGDRYFPCLGEGGGRRDLDWDWVGDDFNRLGRLAVSGK